MCVCVCIYERVNIRVRESEPETIAVIIEFKLIQRGEKGVSLSGAKVEGPAACLQAFGGAVEG